MRPLANAPRVRAMDAFVQDAVLKGAGLVGRGARIGNAGNFYRPTALSPAATKARAMNEESAGPLALMVPLAKLDDALEEANRLPYESGGLCLEGVVRDLPGPSNGIENGMIAMNHVGAAPAKTPFGGREGLGPWPARREGGD